MNSPTFFISDLHLDNSRPEIIDLFVAYTQNEFRDAAALYILGDFFEYWIGDDQPLGKLDLAVSALRELVNSGVPVFFMSGNRDFLVGSSFTRMSGVTLLGDEGLIELCGNKVLIMHGDTLCTDDVEYQAMRQLFHSSDWQKEFLGLSLTERVDQALALRERSMSATKEKKESITDVNADAVLHVMQKHGVHRLIHGHTHRPCVHDLGGGKQRIVLGDWYDQGSLLRVDAEGYDLQVLELNK